LKCLNKGADPFDKKVLFDINRKLDKLKFSFSDKCIGNKWKKDYLSELETMKSSHYYSNSLQMINSLQMAKQNAIFDLQKTLNTIMEYQHKLNNSLCYVMVNKPENFENLINNKLYDVFEFQNDYYLKFIKNVNSQCVDQRYTPYLLVCLKEGMVMPNYVMMIIYKNVINGNLDYKFLPMLLKTKSMVECVFCYEMSRQNPDIFVLTPIIRYFNSKPDYFINYFRTMCYKDSAKLKFVIQNNLYPKNKIFLEEVINTFNILTSKRWLSRNLKSIALIANNWDIGRCYFNFIKASYAAKIFISHPLFMSILDGVLINSNLDKRDRDHLTRLVFSKYKIINLMFYNPLPKEIILNITKICLQLLPS
jgi:hypothetical protein